MSASIFTEIFSYTLASFLYSQEDRKVGPVLVSVKGWIRIYMVRINPLGNLHFWLSGVRFGHSCLLASDTDFREPTRIVIGAGCEIRRRCILDARSEQRPSISLGDRSKIKDGVSLLAYGGHVAIGADCLIQRNSTIFGHGGTTIGDGVIMGPGIVIASAEYALGLSDTPFHMQGYRPLPVEIMNNVYIGSGTTVLGGVSVCENVVVGANSVVTTTIVRPGVYAGAPARFVRPLSELTDSSAYIQPSWGR